MPDNIVKITLNNDAIRDAEGDIGYISGTLQVDYTTSVATGNVSYTSNVGSGWGSINSSGSNFQVSGGVYTLKEVGNFFTISYSGQQPTSASFISFGTEDPFTTNGEASQPLASAAVCFASGTMISTVRGDVAVEALAVGDLVVTSSGERRPIRWIGHRVMNPRRHPHPQQAQPIRVVSGALGENRPARDLVVSPGHALSLDLCGETLIPAFALVNGATVIQEDVASVTYWHIELDSHDLLLAEGVPAESYFDMGNRSFFADNGVVDLEAAPDAATRTHADFCRPFHADGVVVEAARLQLAARARALGWRLEEQGLGDLHLLADGARIDPVMRGLAARFALPASARDVWLVSDVARPCDVGDGADTRRLGVQVGALVLTDGFGPERRVAMDDARLDEGWHGAEDEAGRPVRWTEGRAQLPVDLWAGDGEGCYLRVDLALAALPRWIAPEVARGAVRAA